MRSRENQVMEKRKNGTLRVATWNEEASLAQDQFREQCDVNNIIDKFNRTGEISHIMKTQGVYMDTTNLPNYQQSLQIVIDAEDAFMALPAEMRKKFDNDPGKMIAYLEDPKNHKEAVTLGLMEEKQIPTDTQILNELKIQNKNHQNKNTENPNIKTKTKTNTNPPPAEE